MPGTETLTLAWLLNKLWVPATAWFWYWKRGNDAERKELGETLSKLTQATQEAKLTFITEARMKEAIREELGPYKEDQQEIKILLRGLTEQMITLSKDMAVQNALANLREDP